MISKVTWALLLNSVLYSYSFADDLSLSEIIASLSVPPIQIVYSNDYLQANDTLADSNINTINKLSAHLNTLDFQLKKINENTFIIQPRQTKQLINNQRLLYGHILDSETGHTLIDAEVTLSSQSHQFKSNSQKSGYVFLQYPEGKYHVSVNATGYKPQTLTLDLNSNALYQQDFKLVKQPKSLENLYVTASLYDFSQYAVSNPKLITAEELNDSPHLGNDPTRATAKLPGLVNNGLSAKIHARGGKQNESQVILNGLTLRNPYHFKDFFSIFSAINLSYVEDVSVYTGVFPVKHGGYISSVMEIQSIQPTEALLANVSLGLLNSHMTFAKALDNQSSYIASYRSGGDFFRSELIEFETGDPSFDDLFLQYTHQFENGLTVSAHALNAKDSIHLFLENEDEASKAKYIDSNYWFTVEKPITNDWHFSSTLFSQISHTNRFGELTDNDIQGSLTEKRKSTFSGLNSSLKYQINDRTSLSFGALFQYEKTNINYQKQAFGIDFIDRLLNPNQLTRSRMHEFKNKGKRQAYHANLRYQFTQKLYADLGLRYDEQDWINKIQKSPRFNLSYFFDDSLTFRFGTGRHYQEQSIDSLLVEDEVLLYFEPEAADISVFEIQKQLSPTYALRSEFYYKKYLNVQPYYENLFIGLHLQPELFTDRMRIEPEAAFSKGVDFTLEANHKNTNWSLAYSFSEVKDLIDGQQVYRSWDQQNALKLGFDWFGEKWQLHSLFQYHTGWPRTALILEENEITVGKRNNDRNKDFLNLDLKLSYDFSISGKETRYWIQLSNATNADNTCCSEYTLEENDLGQLELKKEQKYWLPVIPSMGIDIYF